MDMEGTDNTSFRDTLNNSRKDPQMKNLCDAVLIVQGERFPCHRVVLAAASPVFKAMFTNGMKESARREIPLDEVDKQIWSVVLNFLYRAKLDNIRSVEDGMAVVECARRFNFQELEDATIDKVVSTFCFHKTHCWTVFKRAFHHDITDLVLMAASHIKKDLFSSNWKTRPFFHLEADMVEYIVSSDDLRVGYELTVHNALVFWLTGFGIEWGQEESKVQSLCRDRQSYHADLFQHVKLDKMHIEELREVAKTAERLNEGFWLSAVKKSLQVSLSRLSRCAVDKSHYLARSRTLIEPVTFTHRIHGISQLMTKKAMKCPWVEDEVSRFRFRLEVVLCNRTEQGLCDCIHFSLHVPVPFWDYFGRVQFFTLKCGSSKASDVTMGPLRWNRTRGEPVTGIIERSLLELQNPDNRYLDTVDDSITVGVTVYLH